MTHAYIGIDPGSSSGCIATLFIDHDRVKFFYSTVEFKDFTLKEWFECLRDTTQLEDVTIKGCVLEKVHAMPKMNVVAIGSFMKNVGHIEMALVACGIPFTEVTPQTWMKYYGMKKEKDESKTEWKRRLRETLQRLLPNFKATNDTADAMLIAYYAYKNSR